MWSARRQGPTVASEGHWAVGSRGAAGVSYNVEREEKYFYAAGNNQNFLFFLTFLDTFMFSCYF